MVHLNHAQRCTISCMISQGYSQVDIAKTIGKNKSVVNRELKMNCDKRSCVYKADLATKKYNLRQKNKTKHVKFTRELQIKIDCYLREDYSPEQIVGTFKDLGDQSVSHERIYQYIWQDKKRNGNLHTYLIRQGRKYRKQVFVKIHEEL